MTRSWSLLIVDDERDMHSVTKLALRGKRWKDRKFRTTSAFSAQEAIELLDANPEPRFDVALIDVVMETETAGLELCRYIREHCDRTVRIILRTGQPGSAPQEQVMNDYDIDYYLSKVDANVDHLFSVIRACLRSSQDIASLLMLGEQERNLAQFSEASDGAFIDALQPSLTFLRDKHELDLHFIPDIARCEECSTNPPGFRPWAREAISTGHSSELAQEVLHAGPDHALGDGHALVLLSTDLSDDGVPVRGGICFAGLPTHVSASQRLNIQYDTLLLIKSWLSAYRSLCIQHAALEHRKMCEQIYQEKARSIALAVSSVAHDASTPIGVAKSAASTAHEMLPEIRRMCEGTTDPEGTIDDFRECLRLIGVNLDRANSLLRSFTSLNASQAAEERQSIFLPSLVSDCIETVRPMLRRRKLEVDLVIDGVDHEELWVGHPGHLAQVVTNFFQNTFRYAYDEGESGQVRIAVESMPGEGFRIEYKDYGKGIPAELVPKIFDPLVTTGRGSGGTGLGLAICRSIVTDMLGGEIRCDSVEGEGATFTIVLPLSVPDNSEASSSTISSV